MPSQRDTDRTVQLLGEAQLACAPVCRLRRAVSRVAARSGRGVADGRDARRRVSTNGSSECSFSSRRGRRCRCFCLPETALVNGRNGVCLRVQSHRRRRAAGAEAFPRERGAVGPTRASQSVRDTRRHFGTRATSARVECARGALALRAVSGATGLVGARPRDAILRLLGHLQSQLRPPARRAVYVRRLHRKHRRR